MKPHHTHKTSIKSASGWISEWALADAYHMRPAALRKLLLRAGMPCKKTHHITEAGSAFWRTYWPAHLHPDSKLK